MNPFVQSLWLGIIQGLTEFLPVSSDGHLTLFHAAFGSASAPLAMDVALHVGTLGSMILFFRRDIGRILRSLFISEQTPDQALEKRRAWFIVLATIPTGLVGLGLKGTVEGMSASYGAAGIGLLITSVFLVGGEWGFHRSRRTIGEIPWWHMLLLGLVQGAAVWPGLSRSGSTISLALMLGWRWEEAGRMSFLMALPAIAGATLITARDMTSLHLPSVLTGMGVSFLVGCLSLALLMSFLRAKRLWPFAVYCAALGAYALARAR